MGLLALQGFLAIVWRRGHRDETSVVRATELRWALAVPVVFVAAMCAANIRALDGWSQGLDAFGDEVDAATGLVYVDDVLPPNRRQAVWGWTGTSLSLVVRRSPARAARQECGNALCPPRTQAATYEGRPAAMRSQSPMRAAEVMRKRPATVPTP